LENTLPGFVPPGAESVFESMPSIDADDSSSSVPDFMPDIEDLPRPMPPTRSDNTQSEPEDVPSNLPF